MSRSNETAAEREARFKAEVADAPTISAEEYKRKSRRAFLGLGLAAAGGFAGFNKIQNRPLDARIPDVLRKGLEVNESVWSAVGSDSRQSRTYSVADRQNLRVNGRRGLDDDFDPATWSLSIVGVDGNEIDTLGINDVRSLASHDMVWEHKCVEGWSNIVHWTGARFSNLAERYYADGSVPRDHKYVSLCTPDKGYYVGLDTKTALHSQTLLAWSLNGEALSDGHGAPLRLATPVVYGIKQLKRIGTIEFTNTRPADFWAERGYDWHARF